MLSNFVKKTKKARTMKVLNIENIREIIESKTPSGKLTHETGKVVNTSVNKEIKLPTNKKITKDLDEKMHKDKKLHTLEAYSFMPDSSFVIGNNVILESSKSDVVKNSSIVGGTSFLEDCVPSATPSLDANEERKMKVMNFSKQHIQLEYTPSNAALYLPKGFKMISELYKIITVIHNFNKKRGLSLILIKHKDSIERMFKHRVEVTHLEQLNYIASGTIKFIPLQMVDEGTEVDTFKIDILESIDVDFALFNCFNDVYKRWLYMFILNGGQDDRSFCESTGSVNIEFSDSKKTSEFKFYLKKIHPSFRLDEASVPVKPFSKKQNDLIHDSNIIKKIAKEKAGTVLDRIKEKERLRREAFVQEQTVNKDYSTKLANLFEIGDKTAIKLEEAVFKIGGFDCKSQILRILSSKYTIKRINGVEYIVKNS